MVTHRAEGDLAVFFNGKLLDPQETRFASYYRLYIPTPVDGLPFIDPVYFEYDGVHLFHIDRKKLVKEVDQRIAKLEAEATNTHELLAALSGASFTNGPYKVDLQYAIIGQFGLVPSENRTGCPVAGDQEDGTSACLEELLDGIDRKTQGVVLYVRGCDPMPVGVLLRALQKKRIRTTAHYLDDNDALKFAISRRVGVQQGL